MRRALLFAVVTLVLAVAASGQTAGRITGTIKDPDGKPIKGATVRATNEAVNARITSTTDDKGRFAMIGVRSGRWAVVAEAPNFVALQGTADVSSSNMPVLALTLQRDPGPMPGALSKTITDELASAEALRTAGRFDDAITAYQGIQSKNARLTAVDLMLATQQVIGRVYEPMPLYIVCSIIYFLINYSLSSASRKLEARFVYIRE